MDHDNEQSSRVPYDAILLLDQYAPTICKCVTKNKKSCSGIISKYDERWCSVKQSLDEVGIFKADTCIFDLLWQASENNKYAISFLKFMDDTVNSALSKVSGKTYTQLEDVVVKMVKSFGKTQSGYRHHFGEIAVINKLTEDKTCFLKSVEKKLSNGCRVDFEVEKDGKTFLVEVYNINFDINRINDSNIFKKHLERKLLDKILSKLKQITSPPNPMMFVPVLWGDIIAIKQFGSVFEYFKNSGFLSPFMFVSQYQNTQTGEIIYRFESLYNHLPEVQS